MKAIVISVLVAFAAISSVGCSSDPVPDSAPVVRVQVDGADKVDPKAWPCWRWWYGCLGDAELTDCKEKNGYTPEGTICNSCGYTCSSAE